MSRTNGLSLVIPAYSEGDRMRPTLRSYLSYLQESFRHFEIVLAVDGTDRKTLDVVHEFASANPSIFVDHCKTRRGKGGAIISAIACAKFDLIGVVDADNSVNPREFDKLVRALDDSTVDLAIASRFVNGSRFQYSLPRLVLSRLFNVLFRLVTLTDIHDTQCGGKLIRRETAQVVVRAIPEHGWAFDVYLLYMSSRLGRKILEVPIDWRHSGETKLNLSRDIIGMFRSILLLRRRLAQSENSRS